MPPKHLARCKRHPSATAGWRCDGCGAPLCPECVEARRMQTVDLLFCRECGGRADTLLIHRSEQARFTGRLGQVWRYPFTKQGLMVAAGLGAVMAFVAFMTQVTLIVFRLAPAVIGAGLFWGAFFSIMRASVRGENEVPFPDYSDVFTDWLVPATRGLLATSVVWLTLLLYLVFAGGWDVLQYVDRLLSDPMFYMTGRFHSIPGERLLGDPTAWVLGIASLVYLPMALMMAVTGNSLLDALNPVKAVHGMLRLGRDYAVALGTLFTLGAVYLAVHVVSSALREIAFEIILTRWLAQVLECLVVFVMARVLGLLLFTRGDALGYGAASDYVTSVLPADATPRTSLRVDPAPLAAQTPPRRTPPPLPPRPGCRSSPRRYRPATFPRRSRSTPRSPSCPRPPSPRRCTSSSGRRRPRRGTTPWRCAPWSPRRTRPRMIRWPRAPSSCWPACSASACRSRRAPRTSTVTSLTGTRIRRPRASPRAAFRPPV